MASGFDHIYKKHVWGQNGDGSGDGSSIRYTANLRKFLESWIHDHKTAVFVDMPCGMMRWQHSMLGDLWGGTSKAAAAAKHGSSSSSSLENKPPPSSTTSLVRYLGFDVAPAVVESPQMRDYVAFSRGKVSVGQVDMSDARQFRSVVTPAIQKAVSFARAGIKGKSLFGARGAPGVDHSEQSERSSGVQQEVLSRADRSITPNVVVLNRDALQHLPNDLVWSTLANLRELATALGPEGSKHTTLMLGHYLSGTAADNHDIPVGSYRPLNLRAAPYAGIFGKSGDIQPMQGVGRSSALVETDVPTIGYDVQTSSGSNAGDPPKYLLVVGRVRVCRIHVVGGV